MDKYDTSQLTEFPRFEPESSQSGVTTFFSKLWNLPIFTTSESSVNLLQGRAVTYGKSNEPTEEPDMQNDDGLKTETGSYAVELEGRSLPNVLRRISSLIALGSKGRTKYADTELARYWMPDDISRECYECAVRFSALRRRHHCRVCGQIFCSRCCSQRVPGCMFGCAEGLRVCTYCCTVVLTYLREKDFGEHGHTPDVTTLHQDLMESFRAPNSSVPQGPGAHVRTALHMPWPPSPAPYSDPHALGELETELCSELYKKEKFPESERRGDGVVTVTDVFGARRGERGAECDHGGRAAAGAGEERELFRRLSLSLPTLTHRYRVSRVADVWRGCDMLAWVQTNTPHHTRAQASLVCGRLVCAGYVECAAGPSHQFVDYALYRPAAIVATAVPVSPTQPHDSYGEPAVSGGSDALEDASSYSLALSVEDASARLSRSPPRDQPAQPIARGINQHPQEVGAGPLACRAVRESGEEHLRALALQALWRRGLSAAWADVLLPLCARAADIIMPHMLDAEQDPRALVQVKKLPGGAMADCRLVPGLVLSKNLAHRGMPQSIENVSVLLLDCSISYQRVEGRLTSLEPLIMQEREYLMRCCQRVCALRPDLVLLRGGAARDVHRELSARGIALATHVREPALARAARCLRADRLANVDARVGPARLGHANTFYLRNYEGKTLMFLEGCAAPNLGCCMLLRGASRLELARVKPVARFLLLAAYNWKLERAFLADIGATLPQTRADRALATDDTILLTTPGHTNNKSRSNDLTGPAADDADDTNSQKRSDVSRSGDKTVSCGVPIRDFSDPLRSTLGEDEVFLPRDEAKLTATTEPDKWWSCEAALVMSPHVSLPPPYLETAAGRRSAAAAHLFLRPQAPRPPRPPQRVHTSTLVTSRDHPKDPPSMRTRTTFVYAALRGTAEERGALAMFRAAPYVTSTSPAPDRPHTHRPGCVMYRTPSVVLPAPRAPSRAPPPEQTALPDPLDAEQHQRLSVLHYCCCRQSPRAPDFCFNPRVADIELYGRGDMTLAAFLHKYCFSEQRCSPPHTPHCPLPVRAHTRRFVHGACALTVTCTTVHRSGTGADIGTGTSTSAPQTRWWSVCGVCGSGGGGGGGGEMSALSLSLSLTSYLRLRLLGARYITRACPHPLHAHHQHFTRGNNTARFKLSAVSLYEVSWPVEHILIPYDTKLMRDSLIQHLNDLTAKGHEALAGVGGDGGEGGEEEWRRVVAALHDELTATSLRRLPTPSDVVLRLWDVEDRLVRAGRLLPTAPTQPHDTSSGESEGPAGGGAGCGGATGEGDNDDTTGGEEEETPGDKRSVRQILAQLLSGPHSNSQETSRGGGVVLDGLVPVRVCGGGGGGGGDAGALIAAALASTVHHQQAAYRYNRGQAEEAMESSGKDKLDGDRSKAKSSEHVEVALKEGLVCRVYFAAEFRALRHTLLPPLRAHYHIADTYAAGVADIADTPPPHTPLPIPSGHATCTCDDATPDSLCSVESMFVRSLGRCVPWAARGGRSGSSFYRTTDEQWVLKEMTRGEWQQFVEFAPHYFAYVAHCRSQRTVTLLARIVGVFGVVGGGGSCGVLITENVWRRCGEDALRFDLKGSHRHRLASEAPTLQHNVLMDENLLNMRWERPLMVRGGYCAVLRRALRRDTRFLHALGVMDYSLLLAASADAGTLHLGLVDYIRTFTWDKRLEHLVKKNLGQSSPTVTEPAQYRQRFLRATRNYVLPAPQPWDRYYPPREPADTDTDDSD